MISNVYIPSKDLRGKTINGWTLCQPLLNQQSYKLPMIIQRSLMKNQSGTSVSFLEL